MFPSAGGRAVRRLKTHPATPGNTLVLSIDIKLQALVEQLFGDRRGALVAIEPSTGGILAMVSTPTFDPNLFVDGIRSEDWDVLNNSPDRPMINRAINGAYPPGSTFKPFMALAALAVVGLIGASLGSAGAALGRRAAELAGRTGSPVPVTSALGPWAWIAATGAGLTAVASIVATFSARRWAGLSARFDRGGVDGATDRGARRSDWDDLTEGHDPTRADSGQGT